MLFNSLEFMIFFPIVTTLYFIIPHKYRWGFLLFVSCLFYMAFVPAYILILAVTIAIDYYAGIVIEKTEGKIKKLYLIISILSTCVVLFVFKYYDFFIGTVDTITKVLNFKYEPVFLDVLLPIGLSFHTFQSLSYVIEVYRGNQKAEKHFGIYSLYVMFYPQLVAGPIERPQNLLGQFRKKVNFDYDRVTSGLKLMAWGMFKKTVIADNLAIAVNQVYGAPQQYSGLSLTIATFFFAYQIYCDFSGYSDIAIGAAEVMGFKLMDNFRRPYSSKSVSEFWKRWHISLSTWFKDYIYIPLGGNRVPVLRYLTNLMITFIISGLWHGANWTYVVWGGLNGVYLVFEVIVSKISSRWSKYTDGISRLKPVEGVKTITTFCLICFAWIFFRANSIQDAYYIATHLAMDINTTISLGSIKNSVTSMGLNRYEFLLCVTSIIGLEVVQYFQAKASIRKMVSLQPAWIRWSIYYSLICGILIFGSPSGANFIYFQF